LYSPWTSGNPPAAEFSSFQPNLSLIVSGGHTMLVLVESELKHRVLGSTAVPRWSYSMSKAIDEHFAFAYAAKGLPVSIVRYFNSYGPRLDEGGYGSVVANLARQALRGEPITVHGDGKQTRCFTYISDTIAGTLLAGEAAGAIGQAFNIGNPKESSILALARSRLPPELWNRIDEVLCYAPLSESELAAVVARIARDSSHRLLAERGITFTVDNSVVEEVLRLETDRSLGARPLRRAFERLVEGPLAAEIVAGRLRLGARLRVACDGTGALELSSL